MFRNLFISATLLAGYAVQASPLVARYTICEIDSQYFAKLSPKEAKQTPYLAETYVDLVSPFVSPPVKDITHALVLEFRNARKDVLAKAFTTVKLNEGSASSGKVELTSDLGGKTLKLSFDLNKLDDRKQMPGELTVEGSNEKLPYVCSVAPEQLGD